MDRENDERNRASLERLRDLSERLSPDDLTGVIEPPWTAAALLAHIGFWDRFARARWLHAERTGLRTPLALEDEVAELVNDADIPHWSALPPDLAIEECLRSAEEVNATIAALDDDVVAEMIVEGRERLVDRSLHRGEHLEMIERAFRSGGSGATT